jgi:Histidine phosphatase superfamily (branch 1)
MTVRLHLLCHGQTDAALAAAFPDDEPLNPHGIAGATALAGNLPRVDAARCAGSARCVQTAAALDVAATVDPGLSECDYGRWRGHSLARVHADEPDALARWLGEPDVAPHGGESILKRAGRRLAGRAGRRKPVPAGDRGRLGDQGGGAARHARRRGVVLAGGHRPAQPDHPVRTARTLDGAFRGVRGCSVCLTWPGWLSSTAHPGAADRATGHSAVAETVSGDRRTAVGSLGAGQRVARPERGRGWQRGQEYEDRFMNCSRRIDSPQRRHGRSACPYTSSERAK